MNGQNNRLLSTQVNPYGLYDDVDGGIVIDVSPNNGKWFPTTTARIKAIYLFYFLAAAANIACMIWPAVRYKNHPIFIDVQLIEWGWLFVYFSYWVQVTQAIFFLYAMFDLFMRFSTKSDTIHGAKERYYDTVFAISFLNTIIFWAFVFPERVKNVGEQSLTWEVWMLDFANNITPMFMILIETVVVHHRFGETLCRVLYECVGPIIVYGGYCAFSYYAHDKNQHWPYPYQSTLSQEGVILCYFMGVIVLIVGYILAKAFTRCLWSEKVQENNEDVLNPYDAQSFTSFSQWGSFVENPNHQHHQNQRGNSRNNIMMNTDNNNNNNNNNVGGTIIVGSPYSQPSYKGYGSVESKNYY